MESRKVLRYLVSNINSEFFEQRYGKYDMITEKLDIYTYFICSVEMFHRINNTPYVNHKNGGTLDELLNILDYEIKNLRPNDGIRKLSDMQVKRNLVIRQIDRNRTRKIDILLDEY